MSFARLVLATLACIPFTLAAAGNAPRPNIIFILCDDLGYGDIGVFNQTGRRAKGLPSIATPNLDRMAAGGLAMRGMYCPSPVCAPSRASLYTGVTQGHAGVRDNQFDKALENNHTVASVLRTAGYATALIGKWGLQGALPGKSDDKATPADWVAYPTKRGFDYFFGYVRHGDGHEHYPKEGVHRGAKQVRDGDKEISASLDKCLTTDLFTARAKKWIADTHAASPDKPFFLMLTYDTPHAVIELPTGPYPAGGGVDGGMQWTGKPGAMITSAKGVPDSYMYPDYADATYRGAALSGKKRGDSTGDVRKRPWPEVYKRYATSVSRIDECVGDILKLLRDLKIDENTLVVFTTDNGPSEESYLPEAYTPEFFDGFGPFDGIKRDCLEGGIRVGAIAHWTGAIPGDRMDDAPAQFHDWMTTFADLAGVPAPARADGVSLVPSLTGKGKRPPSTIYSEYNVSGATPPYKSFDAAHRGRPRRQMQFIRLGDYVGVRYDVKTPGQPFEIYDIDKDPQETQDLASKKPEIQRAMQEAVLRERLPNPSAKRPYDNEAVPSLADDTKRSPGVTLKTYSGDFPWVPKLDDLTPATTSTVASIDEAKSSGAALITGFIDAPQDGEYAFSLKVGDGCFLRIHDIATIDGDFAHKPGETRTTKLLLKAGRHPFRLYRKTGDASPLLWKTPGASEFVAIPAKSLSH